MSGSQMISNTMLLLNISLVRALSKFRDSTRQWDFQLRLLTKKSGLIQICSLLKYCITASKKKKPRP